LAKTNVKGKIWRGLGGKWSRVLQLMLRVMQQAGVLKLRTCDDKKYDSQPVMLGLAKENQDGDGTELDQPR
jgi:hypothetical protein